MDDKVEEMEDRNRNALGVPERVRHVTSAPRSNFIAVEPSPGYLNEIYFHR